VIAFAVDPQLAAPVLDAERKLVRALRLIAADAEAQAHRALDEANPADHIAAPSAPPALLRRVAADLARVAVLGRMAASHEIAARSRFRFAAFAEPKVSETDIAAYHRVAQQMVEALEADVYGVLRAAVEDGLRQGLTDAEIGGLIRESGTGLASRHCRTWARTETTRYYTLGRTQTIEQAGAAVWGYEYVVIEDDRTTDICRHFIGKRVPKEQMTQFPPFHYNCRTTVVAVMAQWVTDDDPLADGELLEAPVDVAEGFGADPRRLLGV